jgi:hypothetical protein
MKKDATSPAAAPRYRIASSTAPDLGRSRFVGNLFFGR